MNDLLHTSHQNGFSPLCMRWCVFRVLCWLNDFLHTSQQNGFSPLCMYWCLFRWLFKMNDLLHTSQQNVFSPLCMRWCLFRWLLKLNDLLHTMQQNGCSPLCMGLCAIRICFWLNESPHSSQEYRRFSPCMGWSSFKLLWKMRVNNMKNPNRMRNTFEAPIQWDVKSVGKRVVTERGGMEGGIQREREHTHYAVCAWVHQHVWRFLSQQKLHCHCLTNSKLSKIMHL